MKVLWVITAAIVGLSFNSCKKDDKDPGFSSAEGKWTYSTPDSKMSITFELAKSANGYKVQNAKLMVDGTAAETVTIPGEIASPAFSTLRFSANDAKLVYDYSLTFNTATINSDFTEIEVSSAEYTFPWGTTNKLSGIIIIRA